MLEKLEALAQANVDHYEDHKVGRTIAIVVWTVGGFAALNYGVRKMAEKDIQRRINPSAKYD